MLAFALQFMVRILPLTALLVKFESVLCSLPLGPTRFALVRHIAEPDSPWRHVSQLDGAHPTLPLRVCQALVDSRRFPLGSATRFRAADGVNYTRPYGQCPSGPMSGSG